MLTNSLRQATSGNNLDITSLQGLNSTGIVGYNLLITPSGFVGCNSLESSIANSPIVVNANGTGPALKTQKGVQVGGFLQSLENAGVTTSVAPGTGAGTGATATLATGSTDMAGTVTVTSGTGATADSILFTLTFGTAYPSANYFVALTPSSQAAPAYSLFVGTKTTTGFEVLVQVSAPGSSGIVMSYDYHIIQGSV